MDAMERLARTPGLLARVAAQVPRELLRVRSGPFALIEHAWHMADLEQVFGERVRRLLGEEDPFLPDFDGEKVAREKEYLKLELDPALAAFALAREETLRLLRAVPAGCGTRAGRQEGVGTVTLAQMPRRMLDHDLSHLNEIADLLADLLPRSPMIGALRTLAQDGPRSSKAA